MTGYLVQERRKHAETVRAQTAVQAVSAELLRIARELLPPSEGYLFTVKPWSLPYLTLASCQAFRPSESVVEEM